MDAGGSSPQPDRLGLGVDQPSGAVRSRIDVPLQAGTLSKAVGAYGGYLCASQAVIDLMRTRARTFIYSTGLPPAIVLPEAQSAIVPVIVGDAAAALTASDILRDNGFLVIAIRPPTVPAGTARLRLAFTAQHEDGDIARLAEIVPSSTLVT